MSKLETRKYLSPVKRPLVRFFNQLIDHGTYYEKRSEVRDKLMAEFHFLTSVPESLQIYYPAVFDYHDDGICSSYKIDKIPFDDASLVMVFSPASAEPHLLKLLSQIKAYLMSVPFLDVSEQDFKRSVLEEIFEKNLNRLKEIVTLPERPVLNEICRTYGFKDLEEYCLVLNSAVGEVFKKCSPWKIYYSHGDLCLSNIIPLENSLMFIDPKGYQGDIINTYRPIHYDLAKLSHSLLGSYDKINHFQFELSGHELVFTNPNPNMPAVEKTFTDLLHSFSVDLRSVRLVEASLFLSLIPFHKESSLKVRAFLINSLKIFNGNY